MRPVDTIKNTKIYLIRVLKGEEKEKGAEII